MKVGGYQSCEHPVHCIVTKELRDLLGVALTEEGIPKLGNPTVHKEVRVYICMHVRVYICIHVRVYISMHACPCVHMHACACIRIHACECALLSKVLKESLRSYKSPVK